MTTHLDVRYGTTPSRCRPVVIGLVVVLVLGFGAWVGWTAFFHATPAVESELTAFEIVDENEATARVTVALEDGVTASCTLRVYADDHSTVGELAFEPVDGRNEVTVRTERLATSVTLIGCTAPGQPRPR